MTSITTIYNMKFELKYNTVSMFLWFFNWGINDANL